MFGETKTDAKFSETQFCIKIILPLTDIIEYRKDVLFYRMFWEMPHQKWFNRVFEFEDFFHSDLSHEGKHGFFIVDITSME